nr:hypothetical protein [uncultured Methanoregula sp.]
MAQRLVVSAVPVFVGELSPFHMSRSICTAVEHVGIDTATGKSPVINSALPVLKKPAGTVIFHP